MKPAKLQRLFGLTLYLTLLSLSLSIMGCSNSSTEVTTQLDEQDELMNKIQTTFMAQCQDTFKTLSEIDKVDATIKTTDAICRCQVDAMMEMENMEILSDYYEDMSQSTSDLEAMMQSTMTTCADRYYVNLDLWD